MNKNKVIEKLIDRIRLQDLEKHFLDCENAIVKSERDYLKRKIDSIVDTKVDLNKQDDTITMSIRLDLKTVYQCKHDIVLNMAMQELRYRIAEKIKI